MTLSSTVATSHVWLFKFKLKVVKIKSKVLSHTSHILGAQLSQVARVPWAGQCNCSLPSSHTELLGCAALGLWWRLCRCSSSQVSLGMLPESTWRDVMFWDTAVQVLRAAVAPLGFVLSLALKQVDRKVVSVFPKCNWWQVCKHKILVFYEYLALEESLPSGEKLPQINKKQINNLVEKWGKSINRVQRKGHPENW